MTRQLRLGLVPQPPAVATPGPAPDAPEPEVTAPSGLAPSSSWQEDAALLRLAHHVLAAEGPQDVAEALLESLIVDYGFVRGAVLAGERSLLLLCAQGVSAPSTGVGTSATVQRAHDQQAPQLIPAVDPAAEPWLAQLVAPGSAALVVSLVGKHVRLGALVLQFPSVVRDDQRDWLVDRVEAAAHAASSALHREQKLLQLQRLAATDDLTKIANRRGFDLALDRELARSARSEEPVSLVILDLDHFKAINDVFGHPAGDDALRNVAAALVVACREFDTPARYGGEEFAVILPNCGVDECVAIADRLREFVASAPSARSLTASAGVATFPLHARGSSQLIDAADQALLAAKRSGRDCTALARVEP